MDTFTDDSGAIRLEGTLVAPGGLLVASIELTDAQIKALPTTPVEIVAAPGAGLMLLPLVAVFVCDAAAGAYTNFNVYSSADPFASSVYLAWDALINFNDATGPAPLAGGFMAGAQKTVTFLTGLGSALLTGAGADVSGILGVGTGSPTTLGYENAALSVVGQNNAKGDFTGGDPANSLRVVAYYVVVPL